MSLEEGNWKEEILRRILDREDRKYDFEKRLSEIDAVLFKLMNELSFEHNIRTNHRLSYSENNEPYWIVRIDDEVQTLTSNHLMFTQDDADVESTVIDYILGNFTFR
ncbi:hypothetical protein [Paenibacillus sp.]|uniref:hypothetical protein n=1 Tax=Paenibacillus sp. TaxID=58172 RepID=UPI002D6151C5|nr:hypothetical protein [Paenibacillus sp.]HZG85370.1 hypothetical protein [Paenibacillus sp.]